MFASFLRDNHLPFAVHSFTVFNTSCGIHLFPAVEVTVSISNLTLASRTATTLSVTWSAGYPKCYSFTVFHSTQDGSINVTQPADSDTSHTLNSLLPGTTYRIEVEAVRKGDGADGQRAKVMENFTTEGEGEGIHRMCNFQSTLVVYRPAVRHFLSCVAHYLQRFVLRTCTYTNRHN